MKANARPLRSLLLAAGVALMAQSAFGQSLPAAPAPAPDAVPPAKFETTKVADGVFAFRYLFHRNVYVVTSDGVIATDPISPDAAAALRPSKVSFVIFKKWLFVHPI